MLTPSGFPAWCWLQARPKCWLLRSYLLFFPLFQFCSCCPASILVSEQTSICLKHPTVNPELEKKISPPKKKKKKKIPLHCVFSTSRLSLSFFYLVQESCHSVVFPNTKKKGDPRKPISPQTKNRVWKSTRVANGIRPSRTTYANLLSTSLPPCRFMLHRFHRAPICTIEHRRQRPPVSPPLSRWL